MIIRHAIRLRSQPRQSFRMARDRVWRRNRHIDAALTPCFDELGWSAVVGDDCIHAPGWYEREKCTSVPLRLVEDRDDALARGHHLPLDLNLLRIEIHEPTIEADPTNSDKSLVDPRASQDVARRVSDDRHGRKPEHAAGNEDVPAWRISERDRVEQPVRDDDDLSLLPQLEREVVRRRARIERDRLAVADHRGSSSR